MISVIAMLYLVADTRWVELARSGKSVIYVSPDTKRNGRIWTRWDESRNPAAAEREAKIQFESNCSDGALRVVTIVKYDAQGRTIENSSNPSQWVQPAPDSVNERIYETLCN